MLDYENNHAANGLEPNYSLASSGRKVLTRTVHRITEGGVTTDYETRYYTDGYYGRPKGLRYPGGLGIACGYNAHGYLVQEKDASSTYALRQTARSPSWRAVIRCTRT